MVNKLKYQLTPQENNKLDDYWKFIKIFNVKNNETYSVKEYRYDIIKKIQKKYTIDEFYFYEKILNKMLWNLLVIYKISLNKIDFTTKIAFGINGGSYINKQLMLTEGGKNIIFPDYRNLKLNNKVSQDLFKILTILRRRDMYEKAIEDKDYINNIKKIDSFYYPNDYPFPNVNLIEYNDNNKDVWIKRIKAYYFMKDDSHWYKLIL